MKVDHNFRVEFLFNKYFFIWKLHNTQKWVDLRDLKHLNQGKKLG
jgi:hypothetical protein